MSWVEFPEVNDAEEARTEFLYVWEKIRFNPGEDPLMAAYEKACVAPISVDQVRGRTPGYQRFLSMAYWLQKKAGNRNILLPTIKVARLLGRKAMTISRYRNFAVKDGFLVLKKSHSFRGTQGRATEFRFNTDLIESRPDL